MKLLLFFLVVASASGNNSRLRQFQEERLARWRDAEHAGFVLKTEFLPSQLYDFCIECVSTGDLFILKSLKETENWAICVSPEYFTNAPCALGMARMCREKDVIKFLECNTMFTNTLKYFYDLSCTEWNSGADPVHDIPTDEYGNLTYVPHKCPYFEQNISEDKHKTFIIENNSFENEVAQKDHSKAEPWWKNMESWFGLFNMVY